MRQTFRNEHSREAGARGRRRGENQGGRYRADLSTRTGTAARLSARCSEIPSRRPEGTGDLEPASEGSHREVDPDYSPSSQRSKFAPEKLLTTSHPITWPASSRGPWTAQGSTKRRTAGQRARSLRFLHAAQIHGRRRTNIHLLRRRTTALWSRRKVGGRAREAPGGSVQCPSSGLLPPVTLPPGP